MNLTLPPDEKANSRKKDPLSLPDDYAFVSEKDEHDHYVIIFFYCNPS